jgi:hypothetical protein
MSGFLTRPDTNSHRQDPTAGSDKIGHFLLNFIREHSYEFALSLSGDSEVELLNSVGTLGTLGEGLNAFCLMR